MKILELCITTPLKIYQNFEGVDKECGERGREGGRDTVATWWFQLA